MKFCIKKVVSESIFDTGKPSELSFEGRHVHSIQRTQPNRYSPRSVCWCVLCALLHFSKPFGTFRAKLVLVTKEKFDVEKFFKNLARPPPTFSLSLTRHSR